MHERTYKFILHLNQEGLLATDHSHDRFKTFYERIGDIDTNRDNGSLKDHLHSPGKTPLSWRTRIQIAIDVANAMREGRARPSIKQVLRLLYETSEPMHSGFLQAIEDEEYIVNQQSGRRSKGKLHRNEPNYHSGDGRYLASSSSTSRLTT
ncbi:hypothetical protein K1719_016922 [Acacia pycnantha]|nr:hypothetical protein K1719_016922 [Acacia pycnantha]